MQQKVIPLPKTEGAMKAFAIDHGSKRSFVSLFKDVTNAKENVKEEEYSMWSKLPLDLQISIIQCISPNGRDYRNLRGVCRRWKALAPPLRWISGPAATGYPWLVSFDQERKGVYDLYDPASDLSYHMSSTESAASYPVIFASSNGWLLLSQGPQSVSMLEPFTKTRIDLPKMPQRFNLVGGHFFAVDPTSREYLVGKIFRHSPEKLVILGFGSDMTSCACFSVDNKSFTPSRNNLIVGRWHIFGLDQNGRLGRLQMIGNPRQWHVLNESQLLCFPSSASKRFLVASNRGLMSVFVGSSAEWVEVFEFNFSSREWEQVDSLPGNLVLFVGQTSIAVEAEEERMRNKIFFPIFKEADGSIMFYSLETRRFRSFSSEDSYSSLDLHGFRELSNCTWIRPRLVPEKILFTEPSVNKVLRSQLRPSLLDGPDVNETFPALPRRELFPKKVSLTSGQSKTLLDGRDSFHP